MQMKTDNSQHSDENLAEEKVALENQCLETKNTDENAISKKMSNEMTSLPDMLVSSNKQEQVLGVESEKPMDRGEDTNVSELESVNQDYQKVSQETDNVTNDSAKKHQSNCCCSCCVPTSNDKSSNTHSRRQRRSSTNRHSRDRDDNDRCFAFCFIGGGDGHSSRDNHQHNDNRYYNGDDNHQESTSCSCCNNSCNGCKGCGGCDNCCNVQCDILEECCFKPISQCFNQVRTTASNLNCCPDSLPSTCCFTPNMSFPGPSDCQEGISRGVSNVASCVSNIPTRIQAAGEFCCTGENSVVSRVSNHLPSLSQCGSCISVDCNACNRMQNCLPSGEQLANCCQGAARCLGNIPWGDIVDCLSSIDVPDLGDIGD